MLLFQSVTVIVVIDCWLETEGNAGGKRGKLLCCKRIFDQIKGYLAKIQLKKHQNVQKCVFLQKVPGVNWLRTSIIR